jgi:hypothetical protein
MFPYEELSHKWFMVLMLVLSSLMAIVINQTDLSGKRKLRIFKTIYWLSLSVFLPIGVYILAVNLWGVSQKEFVSIENSSSRFINSFCGLVVALITLFRQLPVSKEGIGEYKRKSITASKYQRIFKSLRAGYMGIMIIIVFCYWLNYMFNT